MKKSVVELIFALFMVSLSGSFITIVPAFGEEWVHCVPNSSYVNLNFWMENQTAYIKVIITFPTPCHNVSNWGEVAKYGYSLSASSEIWKWTGPCIQVIWTVTHTYDLGYLEEGNYTFTFKAWNMPVKSIEFTVNQQGEDPTWVKIAGCVDRYGDVPAYGWLNVFAVVDEWAEGWSVFVVPPPGPRILVYPPPPIDYTIYVVKIVNASVVKLDYDGTDFYLSGFWQVGNVTNPSSIKDIANLVRGVKVVTGELNVTDSWSRFIITIEGLEAIRGNVTAYRIGEFQTPWEPIPYFDINYDYKIDMKDIATIARSFGSCLGFDRYDFCADLNFDVKIDMKDIGKCCKFFGKAY